MWKCNALEQGRPSFRHIDSWRHSLISDPIMTLVRDLSTKLRVSSPITEVPLLWFIYRQVDVALSRNLRTDVCLEYAHWSITEVRVTWSVTGDIRWVTGRCSRPSKKGMTCETIREQIDDSEFVLQMNKNQALRKKLNLSEIGLDFGWVMISCLGTILRIHSIWCKTFEEIYFFFHLKQKKSLNTDRNQLNLVQNKTSKIAFRDTKIIR